MQAELLHVGPQLRELRTQLGMSQALLSERTGVSRRTLIRWESGQVRPRRSELDLVRSALGLPDESSEAQGAWNRVLRMARGRLGFSHEAMGSCLSVHPSTVRRFEEGRISIAPELAMARIQALPLHASEVEALLSPRRSMEGSDWTNFDLWHDRLLGSLELGQPAWWQAASDYARLLGEAHRHDEAREVAKAAMERDTFSGAPKAIQFALRCTLARGYFFGSWRSAQRGAYHLRRLQGMAVGRREICDREALIAECLSVQGRYDQALQHCRRAVSIAEGMGGAVLSLRQSDYAAVLLRGGKPEVALTMLPGADSDGPVEFASRARLLSDIQDALGEVNRSVHWRGLAESVIERNRLHGRFRLLPRTRPMMAA